MSAAAGTPSGPSLKVAGTTGRGSSLEPSPASTFGGSVTSDVADEVPPTPHHDVESVVKNFAKVSIDKDENAGVGLYSPPFVRKGVVSSREDPFTSSPKQHGSQKPTPTSRKFSRAAHSDNWRSGSSSGSEPASPSVAATLRSAERGNGYFARELVSEDDEFSETVSPSVDFRAEDAQAIFPPSSCVFVANLLQSETDEALEVAVTQIFREFGVVYVKIRRDPKHMPFAFCQYTNDVDAERAIKYGRGRIIRGRPCRCEKAKAHRLFFFERKYGTVITPQEVRQLLRGFGSINMCRHASALERAQYNLNEGVMVQFDLYDEGQAALQTYRNHDVYKMQSMASMGSPARTPARESDPAHRAYLDTYELDKRSIFVGNLAADIDEFQLKGAFDKFGRILNVTVHKNESVIDASQKHCFAFVEFERQPSVTAAIMEMNGVSLGGKTLRVLQKDSESAKSRNGGRRSGTRPSALAPTGTWQSPAPRASVATPASPMAQFSPVYGSPFSFAGSPYYPYTGYGGMYDAQAYAQAAQASQQYYAAQYSPYPYTYGNYTGSPSYYQAPSTNAASTSGSPTPNYYYQPYPQSAYPSPAVYDSAYSAPVASSTAQDDRSATPTPGGHAAEVSLDTQ